MRRVVSSAVLAGLLASAAGAADIVFAPADATFQGRIAVAVGADGALSDAAAAVDRAADGAVTRAIASASFTGAVGQTQALYGLASFDAVLLVGVGEGPATALELQEFGGRVAQAIASWTDGEVNVAAPDAPGVDHDAAHVAYGARLGGYDFGRWDAGDDAPARRLVVHGGAPETDAHYAGELAPVAAGVELARDLISTPSNIKTPDWFAGQVRDAFSGMRGVRVRVLDEDDIQRAGMGALAGVGQGSRRPPRLVVVRYTGTDADTPPIVFVGKGVTFDTGGISLKDSSGMWRMRYDMSGAAAAVGAVRALAGRGAQVNAVAVAGLAENMPGGAAIRPGDVLTSMSGKTIEVLNTDAEGRLILADALWYAQDEFDPQLAVTIATLTGSVRVALGTDYAGLFSPDDEVAAQLEAAAAASGDPVWRLPIHQSVIDAIQADIADVRNIVEGRRLAGASLGAAFVMEWARPETRFGHLDIASTAWSDADQPTVPSGAAGYGVRLFDALARSYEDE